MERNNSWIHDQEYLELCITKVCDQLQLENPSDRNFIKEIALHSESDGHFFYKVKSFLSLQPKGKVTPKDEDDKVPKITVIMGEYNDGKKTRLPNLLETRLRELRSDD